MKCDICEITCSNKDSYLAHIKGNKHLKTINLFRKLGKPLPSMTTMVPTVDGSIQVTGPRISFVGGSKLSSTGLMLHEKEDIKVYPPGAPLPKEGTVILWTCFMIICCSGRCGQRRDDC